MHFICLALALFPLISNQTQSTVAIKPCEITPVSASLWGHLAVFRLGLSPGKLYTVFHVPLLQI